MKKPIECSVCGITGPKNRRDAQEKHWARNDDNTFKCPDHRREILHRKCVRISVLVPKSVVRLMDMDNRSRSEIARAALDEWYDL